jgi:hypothetical protein
MLRETARGVEHDSHGGGVSAVDGIGVSDNEREQMKVIAVNRWKYIVEMDTAELELLTGSSTWQEAEQKKIGSEFHIRDSWQTIRELQNHQRELPPIANKLRALADLLQPIAIEIPVVQEPAK